MTKYDIVYSVYCRYGIAQCHVSRLMFLQVWRYDEGDVTHVGVGHSGEITAVKISPDGKTIVSVSADGAILRWRFPDISKELSGSGEEVMMESGPTIQRE